MAYLAAFAVSALPGGMLISALQKVGVRQTVSSDAPARHSGKQGTPTMGGLLILAGITVVVVAEMAMNPEHLSALGLLGLTLGFGLIGFLDDFLIATRGKNDGLKARHKFALQILFAGLFLWWLRINDVPARTTVVRFWNEYPFGDAYYLLGLLLIVGMSNAVNFADGLDGLAGGVCALMALGLAGTVHGVVSYGWLALFAGAIAGACCGFLWHNAHPAKVFMGDTGSLPLGAALAGIAIMGKAEAPFQLFAIVPWACLFSVMIQVAVFKYRRRRYGLEYAQAHRVFRRTPIHHHFEEVGWAETKIVTRFWLLTATGIAAALAIRIGQ